MTVTLLPTDDPRPSIAELFDLPLEALEPLVLVFPDEEIPCVIEPDVSGLLCGTTDQHPADVEVLWSCGCALAYCSKFWEWLLETSRHTLISCGTGHPELKITPVLVSPLRRRNDGR